MRNIKLWQQLKGRIKDEVIRLGIELRFLDFDWATTYHIRISNLSIRRRDVDLTFNLNGETITGRYSQALVGRDVSCQDDPETFRLEPMTVDDVAQWVINRLVHRQVC